MDRQINFPEEFPILEGDRIDLRAFTPDDVEAFYKLRSDKEFMKYLGKQPMKNMSEARERVSSMIEDFKRGEGISWKVCMKGDLALIGYIGFWRIDFKNFRGEVGFGLDEESQGFGFMSEALPLAVQYGFDTLDLHSIVADVDSRNSSSIQLLENSGFQKEAYFRENYYFNGSFLDSVYYGLLRSDI